MMVRRIWFVVALLGVSVSVGAQEDVKVQERTMDCTMFEDKIYTPCEYVEVTTTTTTIVDGEKQVAIPVYIGDVERVLSEMGMKLDMWMFQRAERNGETKIKEETSQSALFFEESFLAYLICDEYGVFSVIRERGVMATGGWSAFFLVVLLVFSITSGRIHSATPYYRLPVSLAIFASAIVAFIPHVPTWIVAVVVGVGAVVVADGLEDRSRPYSDDGEGAVAVALSSLIVGIGMNWHASSVVEDGASWVVAAQWIGLCVICGLLAEMLFAWAGKRQAAVVAAK